MPLFLTGPRGIGKSTALRRALEGLPLRAGGLVTRFDAPREAREKDLWLLPWGEEDLSAGEVCARLGGGRPRALPQVFDALGTRLLEEAAADPGTGLLVLDELGFLEAEAPRFREAVLSALRGPKPVLGVVRQGLGAWGDAPLGTVWEVTEENRDELPRRVRDWMENQGILVKTAENLTLVT